MATERPVLPVEETCYPAELTACCELLERLGGSQNCETLLVRERSGGRLLVAKCREKAAGVEKDAEAEILRRLSGPGLPAFAGVYENDLMRCTLREYIPGRTLDKVAAEGMSEAQVREIGLGLCAVLRRLHSQDPPVIHRDIKPQNVILTDTGEVFLIDFGISRRYDSAAGEDTVFAGTRGFAAPEQYGFAQTDCRSDIFSLGVLLCWLMTGQTQLGEVSVGGLERCIRRCTAFDPKDRYQSVDAVAAALRAGVRCSWRRECAKRPHGALAALVLLAVAALLALTGADPEWGGAVSFREPLVEEAVRLALGKEPEEPIAAEELSLVEGVYIVCGDVYATMADYWTYGALADPARLEAAGGGVVSLEDLRMLPNLRELGISGGSIGDLSPLEALEKLESLDLRYNQVTSLAPLAGLPALRLVGFNGNPVEDLSPLAACPALEVVDLCNVPDLTGGDLAHLPGTLEELTITGMSEPAGALSGMTIRRLVTSAAGDPDLAALTGLHGLEDLVLQEPQTVDLSALVDHPGLRELTLPLGTWTEDLIPLLELPVLERVTLPREMEEAVLALGAVPFQVVYTE